MKIDQADIEHLVACVGPVIQHYLTGDLPRSESCRYQPG